MTTPSAPVRDSLVTAFEQIVRHRRSVYAFLPDPVPRAIVEWAIDLATTAPNHYRTRPWRFWVYADAGRAPLATAYQEAAIRLGRDAGRARERAFEAPVMIVAACVPATANPKVKVWEEEFATAAAIHTMLLAFACAGVGSLLSTGDLALSREVHALVGLTETPCRVMAVVSVGYRDAHRPLPPRPEPDSADYARWVISP